MPPQASFGRWTWRDWSLSRVVLPAIAILIAAVIYSFSGWTPPWLQNMVGLHISGGGAGQAHGDDEKGDAQRYVGSIILPPTHGDKCWERKLDNRTGVMWDQGYVNCDIIPPLQSLEDKARGLAARRLKAIGRAFGPKSDDD